MEIVYNAQPGVSCCLAVRFDASCRAVLTRSFEAGSVQSEVNLFLKISSGIP